MPNVKLNRGDSASQQIVDQVAAGVTVTSSAGMTIGLKHPGVLAQFRLVKMLGAQTARNDVYVGMVLPCLYVHQIDGSEISPLASELEIEALIQRLGDAGITAVMEGVQKHFGDSDPEAQREEIKK